MNDAVIDLINLKINCKELRSCLYIFIYMKDSRIWNEQNIISDSHFTVSQEVVLFLVSQQQFGPLREAVRLQ